MAALIVPEGFGSALSTSHGARIDIIIDPARSEQANIVLGLLNSALAPFIIDAEVSRSVKASVSRVVDLSSVSAAETPTPTTTADESAGFEPTRPSTPELTQEAPAENGGFPGANPGESQSSDQKDTLTLFFTAAVKGVVSSQVQEALENPQVRMNETPFEETQNTRRPSLLETLVPGYSLMFLFFLVPNLAMTVMEERETGTLRRLLSAPLPRSRILLGKMLPYFLLGALQMVVILLASKLLFHINLGGAPLALGVVIAASALAMAGMGILIAALAHTQGQADGLAAIVVLAMAVVSGAMFPSISIPGLQMITPHYWSMQGFLNVISRGQGIEGVLLPVGILLTMAAVFFTVGAVRFRFE
jgi:ABC-2 type transport system permease protein